MQLGTEIRKQPKAAWQTAAGPDINKLQAGALSNCNRLCRHGAATTIQAGLVSLQAMPSTI